LENKWVALQSEGKQFLFGCNYDLQTEAVRESIYFPIIYVFFGNVFRRLLHPDEEAYTVKTTVTMGSKMFYSERGVWILGE